MTDASSQDADTSSHENKHVNSSRIDARSMTCPRVARWIAKRPFRHRHSRPALNVLAVVVVLPSRLLLASLDALEVCSELGRNSPTRIYSGSRSSLQYFIRGNLPVLFQARFSGVPEKKSQIPWNAQFEMCRWLCVYSIYTLPVVKMMTQTYPRL